MPEESVLVIPPRLPSRAALGHLAGDYRVILISGGVGSVDEFGAPEQFNGNPRSIRLEAFFAELRHAGVVGRCIVADFQYGLAWLDWLAPLLAPDGFVIAPWTAASGELASAVLAGARTPLAVVEGATERIIRAYPGRDFDSPHSIYSLARRELVRGYGYHEWCMRNPASGAANLAGTRAVLDWIDANLVGWGRWIRVWSEPFGLPEFVRRAAALVEG